jgi:hypothetical protein
MRDGGGSILSLFPMPTLLLLSLYFPILSVAPPFLLCLPPCFSPKSSLFPHSSLTLLQPLFPPHCSLTHWSLTHCSLAHCSLPIGPSLGPRRPGGVGKRDRGIALLSASGDRADARRYLWRIRHHVDGARGAGMEGERPCGVRLPVGGDGAVQHTRGEGKARGYIKTYACTSSAHPVSA